MASKHVFEKFYNTHFDKLYRFVFFRVGRDEQLAQDLVSEIFMKVLKHFGEYDETISKTSWLMTIARNHLANYWRDHKPTESLTPQTDELDGFESDAPWLTESLRSWKTDESKRLVQSILAKLNAVEREIVTFHYICGYSYTEIGEMKSLSEGAVKVAARRAIKKLRDLIEL